MNTYNTGNISSLKISVLSKNMELSPWFEPIWLTNGRLTAIEMLTRPKDCNIQVSVPPDIFFAHMPMKEMRVVLEWQLEVLDSLSSWCKRRRLSVSLNINRFQAMLILSDKGIQQRLIRLSSHVRIEIHERFLSSDSIPERDHLLKRMAELTPLWLDDFGAGSTGLEWLMSGRFEAVKIDRNLMNRLYIQPGGDQYLKGLTALACGMNMTVIAEGIADHCLLEFSLHAGVTGCQGRLWRGVFQQYLEILPECFPG